jgi:soluble lytic murein transglycosylase-like protein
MATVCLRVGVWVVVLAGVVCSVVRPRTDFFPRSLTSPPASGVPQQTSSEQTRVDNEPRVALPPSQITSVTVTTLPQPSRHATIETSLPESTVNTQKQISRYDRVIGHYAEDAGFDWRFVAALIFEESRFDHRRVSSAGAHGLMQLMPLTAQLVGIKNYQDPHANIEAGVKYLSFLSRQFQDGRPHDRLALILASYVMGLGHVEDAQRIAQMRGYDPDCWSDMEQMLPLLEDQKYHSKTLYGYGQGNEAVRYANAILRRYEIYSRYIARDFPAEEEVPAAPESQAASAVAG